MTTPATIIMIEDDVGHARLIEKNIRRAGVTNEIVHFTDGNSALAFLFSEQGPASEDASPYLVLLVPQL